MSDSNAPEPSDARRKAAARAEAACERARGPAGLDALRALEDERDALLAHVADGLDAADPAALVILTSLRWNARIFGPVDRYASQVDRGASLAANVGGDVGASFLAFAAGLGTSAAWAYAQQAVQLANDGDSAAVRVRARLAVAALTEPDDELLATEWLHEAQQICVDADLGFEQALVLEAIGFDRLANGKLSDGESALRRAIDAYYAYGSEVFTIDAQRGLGWAAFRRGRLRAAASRFEATLDLAKRLGLHSREAGCAFDLGVIQHALGDVEQAATHVDAALDAFREASLERHVAAASVERAKLHWSTGDEQSAVASLRDARGAAVRGSDDHSRGVALALDAMLRWDHGDDEALFDAVDAIDVQRDPLAAIASLVAIVGLRAERGEYALRELNRAEEIGACLADSDHYRDGAAGRLVTIGQTFALLADARASGASADAAYAWRAAEERLAGLRLPDEPSDLLKLEPDFCVRFLRHRAGRLLADFDAAEVGVGEFDHRVEFHPNCHWVRIDDAEPIQLASKNQLRLLVKALAKRHFANANGSVSVEELLASCWPGEHVTKEAGRSRIYTAIRALRKMGLGDIIVTGDEGYRLVSGVHFRVAPHTGIIPRR